MSLSLHFHLLNFLAPPALIILALTLIILERQGIETYVMREGGFRLYARPMYSVYLGYIRVCLTYSCIGKWYAGA